MVSLGGVCSFAQGKACGILMAEGFGRDGQLGPAGTSTVLSLATGGLPSAEDSLPLLTSRGKPGLIWSLEQHKQCFFAVVVLFVCLYNIFL